MLAHVVLPLTSVLLQCLALCVLQNKCTNTGVIGGDGRDLTGNFSRFAGLGEFVTYHPLHFGVCM